MMESDVMSVALTSEQEDGFRGSVAAVDLPGTRVATFAFSPLSARRGPAQTRRHGPENCFLFLVRGGTIQREPTSPGRTAAGIE